MTSDWRPEGSFRSTFHRTDVTPTGKAEIAFSREESSAGSGDVLFSHQHARRARGGGSVLAFVLAALAVTYLLVTCMRRLSKKIWNRSQQVRVLAGNFPAEEDKGQCSAHSEEGEQPSSTPSAEGDNTGFPEPGGAAVAAQPEEMGAAALPPVGPPSHTRRRLPAATQILVERTLLLLRRPAEVANPILLLMRPDQCLFLIRTLCRIALAELSAFSIVPPRLQPLRKHVVAAYLALIHQALSTGATAHEAKRSGQYADLRVLQRLLQRVTDPPPESEKLPMRYYWMIMEGQQHVSHWMISQVLHVASKLAHLLTTDSTKDSNISASHQLYVLRALCVTRLHQILSSPTTRHWLQRQQNKLNTTVVYSPADLSEARAQNQGTTADRLNAITNAIVCAGGQPTMEWAPLPPTAEEQQQLLQGQQVLLEGAAHEQQHPGPPHVHLAEAYGLPSTPFPPPWREPHSLELLPTSLMTPPQHQPTHAPHQTLLPFDSARQDAGFPVVHPDPHVSYHFLSFWQQQRAVGQQASSTHVALAQHLGPPQPQPQPYNVFRPHPAFPVELPFMQLPSTPYTAPHEHQVPHLTLLPFDPAQQDAQFPVLHPDPPLSTHHVLSQAAQLPQIRLPAPYYVAHLSSPPPIAFSTSFSAAPIPGGLLGDFSAQSHHSGSIGHQEAARFSSQQTLTSVAATSSSEDESYS
ncbi:hypothetical protein ACSSS7_000349 [Eimeria intestinalis]